MNIFNVWEVCLEGLPIFSWKYMKLFWIRVQIQGKVNTIEVSLFPKLTSWGIRGRTRSLPIAALEYCRQPLNTLLGTGSTMNQASPPSVTSSCISYINWPSFLHGSSGSYKDYQCIFHIYSENNMEIFSHFRAQHDIVSYQLPSCSPKDCYVFGTRDLRRRLHPRWK